jgi:hypothetical protein
VPLDPDVLTRDVHIEMVDNAGNARTGTLTFRNSRLGNGEQLVPEDDIVATLNGSGQATVTLIANINNPGVSPDGSYWKVTEQLDHGYQKVRYVQVDAEDPADPIEYASLLDAEPGGTAVTYVTQAQLLQAVADAIAGLGLDPDLFAKLIGADPITGTYRWDMPIESDHADQIGAIRIINSNEVDATVSPDLFAIYYDPADPDNPTDTERNGWFNEWGGLRIRIPGNPAKISYGDVGLKIFEAVGGGRAIEITDNTGAVVFHIQNGLVTSKSITTTVGPQTFAGNTTMAGTLGVTGATTLSSTLAVTGAATMSSTLAVTGQVTVPTTPTGSQSATSKSYVDGLVAAGAPDATATVKGILKLTGDLGGTANSPTVPGLSSKANDSAVVHNTGTETVAGVKTFSSLPTIPATPSASTDAASKGYVDGLDAADVKLTGNQTVAGNKTFSGNTSMSGTLDVTGAASLSSTLAVTGEITSATTIYGSNNGELGPLDYGLLAWNFPLGGTGTGVLLASPGNGTVRVMRLYNPKSQLITNIHMILSTAGATLTSGQNLAAVYTGAKALVSATGDQTTAWQGTTGILTMALTTPTVVAKGYFYVAVVRNGTTGPTFLASTSTQVGVANGVLSAANSNHASADTGITTTMPSTLGTFAATQPSYWAGVS